MNEKRKKNGWRGEKKDEKEEKKDKTVMKSNYNDAPL